MYSIEDKKCKCGYKNMLPHEIKTHCNKHNGIMIVCYDKLVCKNCNNVKELQIYDNIVYPCDDCDKEKDDYDSEMLIKQEEEKRRRDKELKIKHLIDNYKLNQDFILENSQYSKLMVESSIKCRCLSKHYINKIDNSSWYSLYPDYDIYFKGDPHKRVNMFKGLSEV